MAKATAHGGFSFRQIRPTGYSQSRELWALCQDGDGCSCAFTRSHIAALAHVAAAFSGLIVVPADEVMVEAEKAARRYLAEVDVKAIRQQIGSNDFLTFMIGYKRGAALEYVRPIIERFENEVEAAVRRLLQETA